MGYEVVAAAALSGIGGVAMAEAMRSARHRTSVQERRKDETSQKFTRIFRRLEQIERDIDGLQTAVTHMADFARDLKDISERTAEISIVMKLLEPKLREVL